jgi:hypothetical protein
MVFSQITFIYGWTIECTIGREGLIRCDIDGGNLP